MAAYVIAQVNITDPEQFKQYQAIVPQTLEQYGGRYLARGGPFAEFEGAWPKGRMVVIEFASVEAARTWYTSPEYKEAIAARAGAADINMIALEGV